MHVAKNRDFRTIAVLNARASLKLDTLLLPNAPVENAFRTVVEAVAMEMGRASEPVDDSYEVHAARTTFWDILELNRGERGLDYAESIWITLIFLG